MFGRAVRAQHNPRKKRSRSGERRSGGGGFLAGLLSGPKILQPVDQISFTDQFTAVLFLKTPESEIGTLLLDLAIRASQIRTFRNAEKIF